MVKQEFFGVINEEGERMPEFTMGAVKDEVLNDKGESAVIQG